MTVHKSQRRPAGGAAATTESGIEHSCIPFGDAAQENKFAAVAASQDRGLPHLKIEADGACWCVRRDWACGGWQFVPPQDSLLAVCLEDGSA